jgi:hypothetical protein
MAKKITLKHALPCGAIATRTTAREYSHVVILRTDLVAARAQLDCISQTVLDNFAYSQKIVGIGAGGLIRASNGRSYPVTQKDVDSALASMRGFTDAQAFAEAHRAERLAKFDAEHGDATRGPWMIVGWCGRLDLATKLAAQQQGYACRTDVQVQAVNNGVL